MSDVSWVPYSQSCALKASFSRVKCLILSQFFVRWTLIQRISRPGEVGREMMDLVKHISLPSETDPSSVATNSNCPPHYHRGAHPQISPRHIDDSLKRGQFLKGLRNCDVLLSPSSHFLAISPSHLAPLLVFCFKSLSLLVFNLRSASPIRPWLLFSHNPTNWCRGA